jgi:hypothetical protein
MAQTARAAISGNALSSFEALPEFLNISHP